MSAHATNLKHSLDQREVLARQGLRRPGAHTEAVAKGGNLLPALDLD